MLLSSKCLQHLRVEATNLEEIDQRRQDLKRSRTRIKLVQLYFCIAHKLVDSPDYSSDLDIVWLQLARLLKIYPETK